MSEVNDEHLARFAATLAVALAPEAFGVILSASGLQQEDVSASNIPIDILRRVPGQRATLLYRFEDQTKAPKLIIGKLYRSGRRAARIHGWLTALESDVFPQTGRIRVPHPLGRSGQLHMLLYAHIDGVDLRHTIHEYGHEPFALAARWLARLHDASPLDGLKVRTVEQQIEKSLRWLDAVQPDASPETQQRLAHARDRLSQLLAAPPAAELCTIHHDYYYANLLWDGARIWAIDMDELRIGDPALDVAHFLAHLQVLAYRQTGDFSAYDAQGERFLSTYQDERPSAAIDRRLPLYRAHTLLKLAATEAERARTGWRETTEAFASQACAEIDRLP